MIAVTDKNSKTTAEDQFVPFLFVFCQFVTKTLSPFSKHFVLEFDDDSCYNLNQMMHQTAHLDFIKYWLIYKGDMICGHSY